MVRIAAIQMCAGPDMEENFRQSLRFMEKAAEGGARLVCFPEGHLTRYAPQYPNLNTEDFAIGLDHPFIREYQEKCRELRIIASISPSLKLDGKVYPVDMILDENGEILTIAKKNHIVQTPHFYEQDYYEAGDDEEPFKVVDTSVGRLGIIVCFDRHYPESYRTMALKGADLAIIPVGNEKAEPADIYEWENRIGAFANALNVVMINRVGREGSMDFCGRSLFVNAKGMAVAQADDTEQILYCDMNLEETAETRKNLSYLQLRRADVFTYQ